LEAFLARSKANPFVSKHILGKENLLTWRLADYRFLETDDSLFLNQSFWIQEMGNDAALSVDAYEYDSIEPAALALIRIVAGFQLTDIVRQHDHNFGSDVFAVPGYYAIVFRRNRFVFRLRNTGGNYVACDDFALFLDNLVKDIP